MSTIKIALLGFGTVGQGVYQTVHSHQEELSAVLGKKVEIAAILVKNHKKDRDINEGILVTTDFREILQLSELDIVIEAIVGKEPAFSYLKEMIKRGSHVITANKEMFAHHGGELKILAEKHGVSIGFEATVAGGIPVIQTITQLLNINRVTKLEGILNGTSNFILTEMREKNETFQAALKSAQQKGFAEADPTNDIQGFDAFYKLMILSELTFGRQPDWHSAWREGISSITREQVLEAKELGLRFKLIATVEKSGESIIASVRPALVAPSHPLYAVEGVENAVSIYADIVGKINLQGPGAGMLPTASAMIEDLIHAVKPRIIERSFRLENDVKEVFQQKKTKQTWLMIQKEALEISRDNTVLVSKIDSSKGLYIINADERTVKSFSERNGRANFFQILGEYHLKEQETPSLAFFN